VLPVDAMHEPKPHDATLDTEGVDLHAAARVVVEEHAAAPAAVVGAAIRDASLLVPGRRPKASAWRFGWGAAGRLWTVPADERAPAVTTQAIFDLASLTKPVTALLMARMERAGLLHRTEPLAELLPEVAHTPTGSVSLDLLSAHRAGLAAHVEFFVKESSAEQPTRAAVIRQAAEARRSECEGDPPPDGFAAVYSDLGYMLVGEALAARAQLPLDQLVADHVARPLGLTLGSVRYLEEHEPMARARMVPTECVDWRGGVLRGVVHDENAWVLADRGSAGHAGLFGDAWSVVRLGTAVLDACAGRRDHFLGCAEIDPLVRRRAGGSHTAGFDTRSVDGPSASGSRFGPATFGHLGFTGTSLWMDPDRDLVAALLTNRVHPSRGHLAIRQARPAAYDSMSSLMNA